MTSYPVFAIFGLSLAHFPRIIYSILVIIIRVGTGRQEHYLLGFLSSLFRMNLGFGFCSILPLSFRGERLFGVYS